MFKKASSSWLVAPQKKDFFFKYQLSNLKKCVPLKLFEFQEQFTIGAFLIKLTQFETTGQVM